MRSLKRSRRLDVDAAVETAAQAMASGELVLELHHSTQPVQPLGVLRAVTCLEHAGEVDDGGDRRADGLAEVLAVGALADVVVAARPPRSRNHPDLACRRL